MRLHRILGWSGALLLVGLTACQESPTTPPADTPSVSSAGKSPTYLISFADTAPADLAARIEAAGGRVKKIFRRAGVASAFSDAPDFAPRVEGIIGVEDVGEDRVLQWVNPDLGVLDAGTSPESSGLKLESIGDDEGFFPLQWALKSIHAPKAWNLGARGNGVRVAVLDGGVNDTHVDLAGGVDVACSASMVEGFNFNEDVPGFSHATHVSGIVAARDNGTGTIGVAPGATIMGVKVLQDGKGPLEDVIDGIMYAANPADTPGKEGCERADIINMSLGVSFVPERGDRALMKAMDKATRYAYTQGVTIIASTGNDFLNLDEHPDMFTIPAMSARVLAVSATGPIGFGQGADNFTRPASYSNFGSVIVDFAGPGGDDVFQSSDNCRVGGLAVPCAQADLVISPGSLAPDNGGYFFADGTSMAAPAVAGVAALIIEKHGRPMLPADVKAELRRSAVDLGEDGKDAFYGHGFVNAFRAVN